MEIVEVIVRPLLTEKMTTAAETNNQYGFVVDKRANKIEIKKAVEQKFEVSVESVRTMNVQGKLKRMGRYIGRRSGWKKAVVTLKQGDSITLFEGA